MTKLDRTRWSMPKRKLVVRKHLFTTRDVAHFVGLGEWTVRRHAQLGKLKGQRIKNEWRFTNHQILQWKKKYL